MNQQARLFYECSGFLVDVAQRVLTRDGKPIALTPKAFDVLLFFVQNRDRVLGKDELMKALWPDSFVEEGNLAHNIFVLRKVLGDDQNGNSFIQTIPRRGYRFVAAVKELDASLPRSSPEVEEQDKNSRKSAVSTAEYWTRNSPFRSLRAFEPEDAWLFFGRESETDDLLVRVAKSPVLAVIGNSGSGKSSLIRAGLIPALRQGRFSIDFPISSWRIALFRPSGAPFDYLADVLPSALVPELDLKEQTEFIAHCRERLPSNENALRDIISALTNTATGTSRPTRILLIADQFEEVFTLISNREVRDGYINALLTASSVDGTIPVHLILILRADFYANCLEHVGLSRILEMNLYNVSRMAHKQLQKNIEKRLALAGGRAEPGLIDSLLADVGTEPGDLALLEHSLGLLWEKRNGSDCTLTNEAYSEIGRLRGALGRHADRVYADIVDETHKYLVKKIFLELVQLGEGAQDTRRRVRKMDLMSLGNPVDIEMLLGRLASSRLIATGAEGQQTFVEVSHETLIREWPMLQEWIAHNRDEIRLERRLIQACEEWHALGRDPAALLQGSRLAQGETWFAGHPEAPDLLREFLWASTEFRSEEALKQHREQVRKLTQQRTAAVRLRWFSCALFIMLLVAVGASLFAHKQKIVADSRALAAQAEELLPRDHGRAMDLAISSWQLAKSEEAHFAAAKAFAEPLWILKHDSAVQLATFSPDGQRILSASDDQTARLWDANSGHLLITLKGHTGRMWSAAFSADGQYIVTASWDHTARLWNAGDGRLLAILRGHSDKVQTAAFSPNGLHIVTSSWDHTARLWNAANGKLSAKLEGHTNWVLYAEFSSDSQRVVTASYDNTARVWNTADGRLLLILQGHSAGIMRAKFFHNNERIITTSWDGTARIWNSADGHLLAVLQHNGPVENAVLSTKDDRIVTASHDHTAKVWNSVDGQLLLTLHHDGPVMYAEFSPDGRRIITAGRDHTARIWSSLDGRLLVTQVHADEVNHAVFSPSGQQIVTSGANHEVRIWSAVAGRLENTLVGHTAYLLYGEFSSDGQRIVTAAYDHTARVWNTSNGHLIATLKGHNGAVAQAAFSPDGQRIVTASEDHTARIWDSSNGRLLFTLQSHTGIVGQSAFSADGQRIVTASEDHTARIWDSSNGRLLFTLQGHTGPVWGAAFSLDGQRIVTASEDHTARIWNSADGHLLFTLQGHTGGVWRAAFSPDGQRIVTASTDHTARVWNSVDGRSLIVLPGHTELIDNAVFSPDGQRIVTASNDRTARVWSSTDGHLLLTLEGHTDPVRHAQFSPDGTRVITASYDDTTRVWSTTGGYLLMTLRGHTSPLMGAQFSPDGQHILTISRDQTARIWRMLTLDDIEKILAK